MRLRRSSGRPSFGPPTAVCTSYVRVKSWPVSPMARWLRRSTAEAYV